MTWPSLSIIIPSFQQGQYIERTLLSILKQDYPGTVQVIVSDGGSKDQTVEILRKYPQVKWWSERDAGFADAVMKGAAAATGDILAIQSSDDFYLPGAFRASLGGLVADSSLALISACDVLLKANRRSYFVSTLEERDVSPRSLLMERVLPQHCTFLYRSVFDRVGGVRAEVDMCADIDLWYRALHFVKGRLLPRYTAVYQLHPEQRLQKSDRWYSSLVKMVESCEADPLYASRFRLSSVEKKIVYMRWRMSHEAKHGTAEAFDGLVQEIAGDAEYPDELRQQAAQMGRARGGFAVKLGRALFDGSLVSRLAHWAGLPSGPRIDINWWQR